MRKNLFHSGLATIATVTLFGAGFMSCTDDTVTDPYVQNADVELLTLSPEQVAVNDYLPKNAIIAHRGSEFWAPEESEAAMRWARNIGADYLEIDVQMTKDGVILALHDENLCRTTDIENHYPNKEDLYTSSFMFSELLKLDIGSWFNDANPERARASFVGLDMLTVEDVLAIAEGKRIKRDENGKRIAHYDEEGNYLGCEYEADPYDNGNRPGVYIETKSPSYFPGVEAKLRALLEKNGWYAENIADLKEIPTFEGRVGIANTPARIVLQTFSASGLTNLRDAFAPRVMPTLFLMMDMNNSTPESYGMMINFAIESGATCFGPNIDYVTGYPSSLNVWQTEMIRRTGMDIHAWSFNTDAQYLAYTGPYRDSAHKGGEEFNACDMTFTNRTDLTINYYNQTLAGTYGALNYFRSNAKLRNDAYPTNDVEDNLHANKPKAPGVSIDGGITVDGATVLDYLGY